ncbi:hypothetical protein DFH08DRAFT_915041 [Mycena albidolilacea]|uniref:RNI-like protein n=1 Tax=Mycena albidolilacea TaxID=1033008 RepID=A0AAD6ZZ17_9AGAR|nr:hypothetical protein DFH08DRAFT_915041 [Mycena albidolilacea]
MSLHSPSLGPSSPSPSSSAVTIPIPGKSILKKPPPQQAGLFSLARVSSGLSRFFDKDSGSGSPVFGGGAAGGSASGANATGSTAGGSSNNGGTIGGNGKDAEAARVLKRAHFILPEIAVVYPISSLAPPSTPTLRDEKRAIEERERERRRRVVRANSIGQLASAASAGAGGDTASVRTASSAGTNGNKDEKDKDKEGGEEAEWWAMDKVESFYRECCEGCQEQPDKGIMAAFKTTPPTHPRTVDFSGVQLTFTSASILADVLSIEWGLRKAVFKECDLEELTLKPILHALLIPRSLAYLSLAANRKIKGPSAWRLIGAYLAQAHALTFLDLSQNALDKKAVECVVAALGEYREVRQGLVSLKLDDCGLRAAALETLSRAVRTSSLRNISLRHNKISPTGAVALALMIRDYPDVLAAPSSANSSVPPSPTVGNHSLPFDTHHGHPTSPHNHNTTHAGGGSILPPSLSKLAPAPPPRHPAAAAQQQKQTLTAAQTTYTPYVPRRRQQSANAGATAAAGATSTKAVVASSVLGGVTARHVPSPVPSFSSVDSGLGLGAAADLRDREAQAREREREREKERERERDGPSAALLDKVRALNALPRVGALRTLDLRGNDLRNGITYIAQVLKRNRTLKVLNLAENKLDVACLVSVAEALKYNSSLETLDLSRNPCSGPGLEGIQSLRTAFTLNTALKRLFLRATGLTAPGAIALAEFLPEAQALLHLDLTENSLGPAGVLALAKSVQANRVIRCLDLNIPPGEEGYARMSREILSACVRNTEEAERRAGGGGGGESGGQTPGKGVWGMIEESELARSVRLDEEKKFESDVLVRAQTCVALLETLLAPPAAPSSLFPPPSPADALKQAKELMRELGSVIEATEDPARMEALLAANDALTALVARVPPPGRPTLTLQGLGLKWAPGATAASPARENGDGGVYVLGAPNGNGHLEHGEDEELPTTPRVDKGKARAVPEPEEPEKVLSPTLMLEEDDDDEDGEGRLRFSPVEGEDDAETVTGESPTNRSRSWVEEEGEVFRKGTALLGPEEMEGEYAGEELRKELLEAMVERPPPRPLTDQFGIEIPQDAPSQQEPPPASPQPTSPAVDKPSPRPYVSRRSSSASLMSLISPTIASFTPGGGKIPEVPGSPRTSSPAPASPSPLGANVRPYLPRSRSSSTVDTR